MTYQDEYYDDYTDNYAVCEDEHALQEEMCIRDRVKHQPMRVIRQ